MMIMTGEYATVYKAWQLTRFKTPIDQTELKQSQKRLFEMIVLWCERALGNLKTINNPQNISKLPFLVAITRDLRACYEQRYGSVDDASSWMRNIELRTIQKNPGPDEEQMYAHLTEELYMKGPRAAPCTPQQAMVDYFEYKYENIVCTF